MTDSVVGGRRQRRAPGELVQACETHRPRDRRRGRNQPKFLTKEQRHERYRELGGKLRMHAECKANSCRMHPPRRPSDARQYRCIARPARDESEHIGFGGSRIDKYIGNDLGVRVEQQFFEKIAARPPGKRLPLPERERPAPRIGHHARIGGPPPLLAGLAHRRYVLFAAKKPQERRVAARLCGRCEVSASMDDRRSRFAGVFVFGEPVDDGEHRVARLRICRFHPEAKLFKRLRKSNNSRRFREEADDAGPERLISLTTHAADE